MQALVFSFPQGFVIDFLPDCCCRCHTHGTSQQRTRLFPVQLRSALVWALTRNAPYHSNVITRSSTRTRQLHSACSSPTTSHCPWGIHPLSVPTSPLGNNIFHFMLHWLSSGVWIPFLIVSLVVQLRIWSASGKEWRSAGGNGRLACAWERIS